MVGLFKKLFTLLPHHIAYAHCDIPCGIYDPYYAQVAGHTVLRMTNLILDRKASGGNPPFQERKEIIHDISRFTKVKEEHAEILKHEIRVIWGDYFKEEHIKEYPHLHELVFSIMKLASKARQEIDIETANELLEKVQEFSEIFLKTKGVTPIRVPSLYPTGLDMVVYSK